MTCCNDMCYVAFHLFDRTNHLLVTSGSVPGCSIACATASGSCLEMNELAADPELLIEKVEEAKKAVSEMMMTLMEFINKAQEAACTP
jgi:hypothetical protein